MVKNASLSIVCTIPIFLLSLLTHLQVLVKYCNHCSLGTTHLSSLNQDFIMSSFVFLKVLGRGEKWRGGDYMSAPGGGQKVRLLKAALEDMKDEDKIILFIDR